MSEADALVAHQLAIEFLYSRIDYERSPATYSERTFKLDRMSELLARLGDPHKQLRIVHVAGTKGKGSTAAMIATVLSAAGYRVGLFSSPHMFRVEERLTIDGKPCSAVELTKLVELVAPQVTAMESPACRGEATVVPSGLQATWNEPSVSTSTCVDGPTFFEIITAMALVHFARQQADVAVLEVGLGGRLDSTNVCQPLVSVITSISYDHTRELGPTLGHIAGEKAGIIKPGVPVVSGVTVPEARDVIRERAAAESAPLWELGRDFDFDYRPPRHVEHASGLGEIDVQGPHARSLAALRLGLVGRHQGANAAIAVATIARLEEAGLHVHESAVRQGLANVECPARVQVVSRQPTVIVDAAHNVASVQALVETLQESFAARRRYLIFATTRDKDVLGMLRLLIPCFDEVLLTRYMSNPRGVPVEELGAAAAEACPARRGHCRQIPVSLAAWEIVQASATADDLICVTGSFFLAADLHGKIVDKQSLAAPKDSSGGR